VRAARPERTLKRFHRLAAGAALLLALAGPVPAQDSRPAAGSRSAAAGGGGSRLVALIVVDQLASEVLRMAWPHLGPDGFKRLAREGAFWPKALYDHACSETGPGHATLSTGASPAIHGIVGNEWIDAATAKIVGCVDDKTTGLVPGVTPGSSAHRLLAPTFGDALKAAFGPAARIAAVSIKDRAAILPAGAAGDFVVWYDRRVGRFVTSTAFLRTGVDASWIERLNAIRPIETFSHSEWEKVGPAAAYADLGPDDDPVELSLDGSRAFPHVIEREKFRTQAGFCEAVCASPAGLELVSLAARFLIDEAKLGQDDTPDFLGISFSSTDLVGHLYGPESHEVRDMTIRADRTIAGLLSDLDRIAGKGRYHVILSADHGIGPIPESLARRGVPAGRMNADKLKIAIEGGLREAYGAAPESRHWVARTLDADVLLDRSLLGEKKIALAEAQDRAALVATTAPGVAEAIAVHRIFDGSLDSTPIHDAVRHAQMESRSVDLYVVPKPHWLFGANRANHGTPHEFDRLVPLFLCGPGIKPGFESAAAAAPGSAVVTIAAALGIPPPARADHPVLREALVSPAPR
jgi:hypothetical protein